MLNWGKNIFSYKLLLNESNNLPLIWMDRESIKSLIHKIFKSLAIPQMLIEKPPFAVVETLFENKKV